MTSRDEIVGSIIVIKLSLLVLVETTSCCTNNLQQLNGTSTVVKYTIVCYKFSFEKSHNYVAWWASLAPIRLINANVLPKLCGIYSSSQQSIGVYPCQYQDGYSTTVKYCDIRLVIQWTIRRHDVHGKIDFLGCNFYHNRDSARHVASVYLGVILCFFEVIGMYRAGIAYKIGLVTLRRLWRWHCSISFDDLLPGMWFLAMSSLMFFGHDYQNVHTRANPIPDAANSGVNFIESRWHGTLQ